MSTNPTPLTTADFHALKRNCATRDELGERLCIRIESGEIVQLRDNYLTQLWNLIKQEGTVDTDWLCCGANEVFFLSQARVKLVVHVNALEGSSTTLSADVPAAGETFHLLLDQSSSMSSIQSAAYDGAREIVEALSSDTTVMFSTFSTNVCIGQPCEKQTVLNCLSRPRVAEGATALYDAITQAVQTSTNNPGRATLVIVTDGVDTCSTGSKDDARLSLTAFQENGHKALFLGSNQDAILSASVLGIPVTHSLTFGNQPDHMRNAFRSASGMVSRMRAGDNTGFLRVERTRSVGS